MIVLVQIRLRGRRGEHSRRHRDVQEGARKACRDAAYVSCAMAEHDGAVACGLSHVSLYVCPGPLRCNGTRQCSLVHQTLLLVGRCVGIGTTADEGTGGEREAGARAPAFPDPFYARQRAAPKGALGLPAISFATRVRFAHPFRSEFLE